MLPLKCVIAKINSKKHLSAFFAPKLIWNAKNTLLFMNEVHMDVENTLFSFQEFLAAENSDI